MADLYTLSSPESYLFIRTMVIYDSSGDVCRDYSDLDEVKVCCRWMEILR